MKFCVLWNFIIYFLVNIGFDNATTPTCWCKAKRSCYNDMLHALFDEEKEEACVENAAIGTSTLIIFLKALKQFCGNIIKVNEDGKTFESRTLYEVIIHKDNQKDTEPKPVIVMEAGQEAGTQPVQLALYVIQQLVACQEYNELIEKARWVILPCTNPDGREFNSHHANEWKKNLRDPEDKLSDGVDISRNFDNQWGSCNRIESGFAPNYPGPAPASENETIFIKNVLGKYKKEIKVYLSIRKDGHSILYPYGYTKNNPPNDARVSKVAGDIAMRVNQRVGGVQVFVNESIYDANGAPHCGHSVDYAYDLGIPLSYEMRVFFGTAQTIMSKFQPFPRGYQTSLISGYFSGIRELYNAVINEKKHSKGLF